MKPCECGSTRFIKLTPVKGDWQRHMVIVNWQLMQEESFTDSIEEVREPARIECANCRKKHPNPDKL